MFKKKAAESDKISQRELKEADVMGIDFHDKFSPSVSLEGMEERLEEKVQKVRKIRKNNIFSGSFFDK